jgi:hypothetical protein
MSEITKEEFLTLYPQFNSGNIPEAVLTMYLDLANKSIQEARWHEYHKVAVGLFTAHCCTLWLEGSTPNNAGAAEITAAGAAKGLVGSKSVSGVSVSYDNSSIFSDFAGYGSWKLTKYGLQLLSLLQIVGKGAIAVW